MPPVAAAIAASVATSLGVSMATAAFIVNVVGSLAFSAISRALAPKPKKAPSQDNIASQTITSREPIGTHKIVYGEARVGGTIIFQGGSVNNQFFHFVVALAGHEVTAINEIWFNDTSIPNDALDGAGNVISGRYAGVARIKKILGTDTQVVDPDWDAEFTEVTSAHRCQGIAYIYVRLKYDQDKFPSGIPNVTAFVKGKPCFDPRTSQTLFTMNPALMARDYLTNARFGFSSTASEIDDSAIIAGANASDEMVTVLGAVSSVAAATPALDTLTITGTRLDLVLGDRVTVASTATLPSGITALTNYFVIPYQYKDTPRIRLATSLANAMANIFIDIATAGSGSITVTKNAEPRYHAAGILDTANNLGDNLLDILSAFGAKAIYAGGLWRLNAAIYQTPIVSLNESHIKSEVNVQTRLTRRDRFNGIRGVYTAQINDFQPADYPALLDNAGVTADGEAIYVDYDLPFTNRPYTAQRLAKVELKKSRQEIVVKAVFMLHAMRVQAGSTLLLSLSRMGWVNKPFEVTEFRFVPMGDEDNPDMGVELTLRETASAIFDWSASEQSDIDPAPNTNLPNGFDVSAVTGLSFNTVPIDTLQSDQFFNIVMAWDAHPDFFVTQNGQFELQFKRSVDVTWSPSFFVSGNVNQSTVTQGSLNTQYDIRIRAINNLGVRSNWNSLFGVIVGTSGGVTETQDWGFYVGDPVVTSEDWGSFIGDPVTITDDFGSYR